MNINRTHKNLIEKMENKRYEIEKIKEEIEEYEKKSESRIERLIYLDDLEKRHFQ